MNANDAMVRMMADLPREKLQKMLDNAPDRLEALYKSQYLAIREPYVDLDSQEANELVTEEEGIMETAAQVWGKLSPDQKKALQQMVANHGGSEEYLAQDLQMRQRT